MSGRGRLAGKVAIITGAARGMGAAEARLFVAEGARVVLADVNDNDGRALAEELGDATRYVHLDVRQPSDWENVVDLAESTFGGLDILVNNAGISIAGTVESTRIEDFQKLVEVNQLGVLLGMQAVTPPMRRNGAGSIVNIASAAGVRGEPELLAYTGTKFAVRGMTQVAASELAASGIRVNVLDPGVIDTPMHGQNSLDRQSSLRDRIPLGRFGDPSEVAQGVLFLASDASSYVTGVDLLVDGGILLTSRMS